MTTAPLEIPPQLEDLTPEFLTQVVRTIHRDVTVTGFNVLDVKRYGEIMVSTSDRLKIKLSYAAGAPDYLPQQIAVKMKRSSDGEALNTENLTRTSTAFADHDSERLVKELT